VHRSTYYQFLNKPTTQQDIEDQRLSPLIQGLFKRHRRRYGVRRITSALQAQGEKVGADRVRRLMKKLKLVAIQPKSFQPKTTQSRHSLGYNENLLLDRGMPTQINEVWLGDITYLPLVNGKFAYLAVLMDWYSRKIVGWGHETHMREELVLTALRMAIKNRQPPIGLIHHTDRGGQYAGGDYRSILKRAKIKQSMCRSDTKSDNNFMESYFSSVKRELELEARENAQISRSEIAEYIQYYNEERIHSSLGYKTPCEFEQLAQEKGKSQ